MIERAARGEPPGPELEEIAREVQAAVCPYRGLRPFREEDATTAGTCSLVLTLRGDFFGRAGLAYRKLAERLQDAVVPVSSINRHELERAVTKPAEKVGLAFETGLAQRILQDAGDEPGNLPLLEYVLTGLRERRRSGRLLRLSRAFAGVCMLLLGVVAVIEWVQADVERQVAPSRGLSAASDSHLAIDPETALCLAREAAQWAREPWSKPAAEDALRGALVASHMRAEAIAGER